MFHLSKATLRQYLHKYHLTTLESLV
jgi:hypothetical protein